MSKVFVAKHFRNSLTVNWAGSILTPVTNPRHKEDAVMNGPPALTEPSSTGRRRGRLRLLLIACALALGAATTVALPGTAHAATCSNQTGTNNGYYYQMWSAGQGSACITIGSGGNQYSTNWSGIGDFVAGVGWQPGQQPDGELQRKHGRQRRHRAGLALRLVHQPAGRVLRHRERPGRQPVARHLHGHHDQRRRYVQPLRAPAGQPALHYRQQLHLRAVPGGPAGKHHQRDHHHAELLQRVGQPRDEPRLAQLPDLRDRGLGWRQW